MWFHYKCSQREGSVTKNKGRYLNVFHLLNYTGNHLCSNNSFPKISGLRQGRTMVFPGAPTEAQMNRYSVSTSTIKTIELKPLKVILPLIVSCLVLLHH